MEIELNFAGVGEHALVLEEAGRRLSEFKDMLSLWYQEEKSLASPKAGRLHEIMLQAERIERSVQKRRQFLDGLVCDFQSLKDENASKLAWCEELLLSAASWEGHG